MGFSRVDRGNPRVRKLTAKASRGGVGKRGKRVVKKKGLREHLSRLTEENANSETSDTADLTADINWEDNTGDEISSLMEAFCPPVNHVENKPTSNPEEPTPEGDASLYLQVSDVASFEQVNSKVLVQTYNETEWVKGVVTEVDCEENEVLVHFEDSGIPDEWLNVKSQRIKFLNEGHKLMLSSPAESQSITIKPKTEVAETTVNVNDNLPVPSIAPPILKRSVRKKIPGPKFPTKLKTLVGAQVKMSKRSLTMQAKNKRRLPTWKTQKADVFTQKAFKNKAKFKEGEKVLAKWSDHRMQKFPAVIKKISGLGLYDVLFYDGFEKTISEENIYKGTEEEIAKYKHSKPSEADNFVDMDIASKEERRKKKRKIFDDYFSDQDLRRRRKTLDTPIIDSPVRVKKLGVKESLMSGRDASPSTDGSDIIPAQSLRVQVNKISKKVVESLIQADIPLDSTPNFPDKNTANLTVKPTEESQPADLIVSDSQSEQPGTETTLQDEGKSLEIKINPVLVTCHDGRQRKSIVINDSDLPFGWSKHVIAWVEGTWASFLITPEGYSIHSMDELKRYYLETASCEPPNTLVFSFPKDKIKEIAESQQGIPPTGKYKKWASRSDDQKKPLKKARTMLPSRHLPLKRVRTLLPKHRSGLPSGISKPQEGRLWKCPKESCDKQFRKENLLQMHIKHYHSEFKALAGSAPKVVDLAQARSAETWSSSHPRSTPTIKRLLPKTSASHESNAEKLSDERLAPTIMKHSPKDYNPGHCEELSINADTITEEKPTIKTLIPVRSPRPGSSREYDEFLDIKMEPGTSSDSAKGTRSISHFPKKLSDSKLPMEDVKDYHSYFKGHGSRGHKRRRYFHHTEKPHASTSNDSFPEEEKSSPGLEYTEDGVVIERLKSEEVINCSCGFREEDGLMIQCEICLCWQHGVCHGIENDRDVPNNYVCQTCLNPPGVRSSQKYMYAWQFLTQGKLSRFSKRTCNEEIFRQRQRTLARSFELTGNIRLLEWVSRGIANKLSIAEQPDHPKLYMWSANWANRVKTEVKSEDSGCLNETQTSAPVPEAPIDMDDCRSRLMDDIEQSLQEWDNRLTSIQAQLAALEAEDADLASEDHLPLLKQAIYMLVRDLVTARTAVAIS